MAPQGRLVHHRDRVVGREIVAVVLQHHEVHRGDEAVGGATHHQVHLPVRQRLVEQSQVHLARRHAEAQAVRAQQARHPVRPLEELAEEAHAQRGRVGA